MQKIIFIGNSYILSRFISRPWPQLYYCFNSVSIESHLFPSDRKKQIPVSWSPWLRHGVNSYNIKQRLNWNRKFYFVSFFFCTSCLWKYLPASRFPATSVIILSPWTMFFDYPLSLRAFSQIPSLLVRLCIIEALWRLLRWNDF